MKTEVIKKDQEIEYPCLMKSKTKDKYVLFISPSVGMVVRDNSENPLKIGDYSEDWAVNKFAPTKDIIKISN